VRALNLLEAQGAYRWLGATDAAGRIVAATIPGMVGTDQSGTSWFRAVRTSGAIHVDDLHAAIGTPASPALTFAAPVRGRAGDWLGAVVAEVPLTMLKERIFRFLAAPSGQQGRVPEFEWQILREDGTVLADSMLGEGTWMNLLPLGLPSVRALREAQAPGFVLERHPVQDLAVVTGYARMRGVGELKGWGVLLRQKRGEVLAPIWGALAQGSLIVAIGYLPLLILLFWSTYRVEVAWGDAQSERLRLKGLTDISQLLLQAADPRSDESEQEEVLRQALETAVSVTGARYGALGLFDEAGQRLVRFLPLGMDGETIRRIGTWPVGRGLLGALGQESEVLRLQDLTRHPAFTGFPPGHPAMRSFLGVAIRVCGRLFGRFYLAEKKGGGAFSDLDEQVLRNLAAQLGTALERHMVGKELTASQERYRTLIETLPLSIVHLDQHGVIQVVNESFLELSGRSKEELIGLPLSACWPARCRAGNKRNVKPGSSRGHRRMAGWPFSRSARWIFGMEASFSSSRTSRRGGRQRRGRRSWMRPCTRPSGSQLWAGWLAGLRMTSTICSWS
jgi:PAS domain-containing protein